MIFDGFIVFYFAEFWDDQTRVFRNQTFKELFASKTWTLRAQD